MKQSKVATDGWAMVRDERTDIVGLLSSLTEEQWNMQSLCTEWRVRDVIGHLIGSTEFKMGPALIVRMAACGFSVNKLIARDGISRGSAPSADLIKGLEAIAANKSLPPGVKIAEVMLADNVLHHQDILRPLGLSRRIPEERLRASLDALAAHSSGAVDSAKRIAGLRLHATDIDWSVGDGLEVSGPGEAILLAMGGRTAGLSDLTGAGKATLASRV